MIRKSELLERIARNEIEIEFLTETIDELGDKLEKISKLIKPKKAK